MPAPTPWVGTSPRDKATLDASLTQAADRLIVARQSTEDIWGAYGDCTAQDLADMGYPPGVTADLAYAIGWLHDHMADATLANIIHHLRNAGR